MESFKKQVIDPYVGQTPKPEDFEYKFRERLVLAPVSWRIGQCTLPSCDQLTSQADRASDVGESGHRHDGDEQ